MKVNVVNYQEKWKTIFKQEAQRLQAIFGDELTNIYHIGSTSVDGLKAKPIIDMMPVVKKIERIDRYNNQMREIGYEALGEFGIKERRFFRKGQEERTHHIHVFQADNYTEIDRHVAVRDFLRAYSDEAVHYGNVKEKLARQFPEDMESYINGKDAFVKNLEKKALRWFFSGHSDNRRKGISDEG
ncbi:GrpB-like predicted nucleotidyltransferase (UPF0157 family) [Sinobaca qinghaiensis]|uniref:GrpB-like predicted nucleotidyltransferase (UPF0157 family) n=1 Tax=Sinobaca qinghaiensis TaxID=342944 RepID=A0A419UX23_9BACL|nr:GrpB family protein [Sinobaca qinghaiensis]RKD69670.1 GrpB-like predicted nucleotidyltransferase (UPF0157 family) [Sinobaca qinghaiensis]